MKKVTLKQGTLAWEKARENRVGSSEVFDIVRYYATEDELHNCGLSPDAVWDEKPYTTVWALYHKLQNDGIFQRQELPPELAEYGHAVEPYGVKLLQEGRHLKLKSGEVYISDRLIASLDVSGFSEEVDARMFDYGTGFVPMGRRFVCEQKTMMPVVLKNGLPIKYIIQAQYQIEMTGADFYILQIMILDNDTTFERGKIVQMSKAQRSKYLDERMTVTKIYFKNNENLAALIRSCIDRFFSDVDSGTEPTPYIQHDTEKNILKIIRQNTSYNKDLVLDFNLSPYIEAKKAVDRAEQHRKEQLQKIIETAKQFNASRFKSEDGTTASFSASGAFLIKYPKV